MIGRPQRFIASSIAKTVISCVTLLGLIACGIEAGNDVSIQDGVGIIGKDISPVYKVTSSPVHSMVFLGEDRGSGIALCGGLVVGRRQIITARHCAKPRQTHLWVSFPKGDSGIDNKDTIFSRGIKRIRVIERVYPNQVKFADGQIFDLNTEEVPGPPAFDIALLRLDEDVPADVPIFDITKVATEQDLQQGHLVALGYNTQEASEAGILKGYTINLKRAINVKAKAELPTGIESFKSALSKTYCFGESNGLSWDCKEGRKEKIYGASLDSLKMFVNFGNGLCEGDSGSPLFVRTLEGEFKFIGVVSEAFTPEKWIMVRQTRCAVYGTYQMVNPVRDWLEAELK